MRTCAECKWFDVHTIAVADKLPVSGFCRRDPPAHSGRAVHRNHTEDTDVRSVWPSVVADDWCGSFFDRNCEHG